VLAKYALANSNGRSASSRAFAIICWTVLPLLQSKRLGNSLFSIGF
jgi:hypothetical protein